MAFDEKNIPPRNLALDEINEAIRALRQAASRYSPTRTKTGAKMFDMVDELCEIREQVKERSEIDGSEVIVWM